MKVRNMHGAKVKIPKAAVCRNFFPLQTANVAFFSNKNPIIWIFCMFGWLAVSINLDKWSSTVSEYMHVQENQEGWKLEVAPSDF
jgi:nitrous oxide reductase